MTDVSADQLSEDAAAPKGRIGRLLARRKLVLALAGVLGLMALVLGLWLSGGLGRLIGGGHAAPAAAVTASPGSKTATLDLGEMIANITGNSATNTPTKGYLKIRLDLVYPESDTNTALMKQKEPYVRDAFVSYLRQLNEEDLRGSDGLYRLKAELLKRARAASGSDAVQEVLVSELVMQ